LTEDARESQEFFKRLQSRVGRIGTARNLSIDGKVSLISSHTVPYNAPRSWRCSMLNILAVWCPVPSDDRAWSRWDGWLERIDDSEAMGCPALQLVSDSSAKVDT
jgi:hypothetical protein